MLVGKITPSLEPVIECSLLSKRKQLSKLVVIDTGFNGYISVPEKELISLGWIFLGYEKYEIATGEIVRQRIYKGQIKFIGVVQNVVAVSSQAEDILIGTRLLHVNKCVLNLNFLDNSICIKRT